MPEPGISDVRDPSQGRASGQDRRDRFSVDTRDLPAAVRADAWRTFWEPVVQVAAAPTGPDGFLGRTTLRRLGGHVLVELDADPAGYRRPRSQGLRDGLDHWLVALRTGGGGAEAATIWLGSLSLGFGLRGIGGRWSGIFIRPERLPQLAPVFATWRAVPVASPAARMLAGMLPRIAAAADEITPEEAPRLEGALSSTLVACLLGWEVRPTSTRLQLEAARRARVIALVDAALGDADLSPGWLVERSGISRSELYRCFGPVGGIARAIQLRRLRRAYIELARPGGLASVSRIAEAVGFFDPSSFTRTFRREFGCTPSEVLAHRPAPEGRPSSGLSAALSSR